ncbi:MAG: hypothetical protein HY042_04060 [Spirochaetia bacterium]|nr:hypothetical protein [Spirochaetia bacterium]
MIQRIFKSNVSTILLLGLVQGLLSALSLEPHNYPLVRWLCPWPLFYFALRFRNSVKLLLVSGAVSAFFLCCFAFYWLIYTFVVFGGMPLILAVAAFVPYTIVLNLKMPAFVLLMGLAGRRRFRHYMPARWVTAAFLALITDYMSPQIFPWYWGNLLAGNNPMAQLAEFTGIYGLSFILFAGSFVAYDFARGSFLLLRIRRSKKSPHEAHPFKRILRPRRLAPFAGIPLLVISLYVLGMVRISQMDKIQEALPKVRVASLQPNAILELGGDMQEVVRSIGRTMAVTIPRLAGLAAEAAGGRADLIVLPESAVPFYSADPNEINTRSGYYQAEFEIMVQLLAYNWNTEVFFNEITQQKRTSPYTGQTSIESFNAGTLYGRDGRRKDSYFKRVLLAWGEYIPGRDFLERTGLIYIVPAAVRSSRFYPGSNSNLISVGLANGKTPYTLPKNPKEQSSMLGKNPREFEKEFPKERQYKPDARFLPLICYEILIPEHIRSFFSDNKESPDFIVNITQDGWYGDTVETYQHYELGRIRAIETRRAIVRSTNSGSSGFVDLSGRYVTPLKGSARTRWGTEDFQVWDVPLHNGFTTLYTRFGNAWIWISCAAFLAGIGVRWWTRRKR